MIITFTSLKLMETITHFKESYKGITLLSQTWIGQKTENIFSLIVGHMNFSSGMSKK